MSVSITHKFVNPVLDNQTPGEVGPDEWNDTHTVPVASASDATTGTSTSVLTTPANVKSAIAAGFPGSFSTATVAGVSDVGYWYGLTPSLFQAYAGSSSSPKTDTQPVFGVSRYEQLPLATDTQGAQNAPLNIYTENHAPPGTTTIPYGNVVQTNGALFVARQYGYGDAVGSWSQAEQNSTPIRQYFTAAQMSNGGSYEIAVAGTTNFTLYGAGANTVGTVFIATGPGTGTGQVFISAYAATALVNGALYQIKTVGTTDFTVVGAANNNVGTNFRATGAGTGSGTAIQMVAFTSWANFNNAVASAGSFGGLVAYESNVANNSGVDHTWAGSKSAYVLAFAGYLSAAVDAVSNGTNRAASGYAIRGGSSKFDVGLGAYPGSIVTSFLQDDSSSITSYTIAGSHTNGIDLTGGTYSGYAIKTLTCGFTNSAAPSTPASGLTVVWADSTTKTLKAINDAGALSTTVIADTGASNNFLTAISTGGVISKAQPTFSNLATGTAPAFTLGGTISGGGNQINNVIIGTATPLAIIGTTISANTQFNIGSAKVLDVAGNYTQIYASDGNERVAFGSAADPSTYYDNTNHVFRGSGGSGTFLTLATGTAAFNGYVKTATTTVASLPAAGAGLKGARYFVTDATATTFHSTVVGGGANNVGVTCDGTNWYIG